MAITTSFLEQFAAAWNRHDCECLLTFVTDDAVFETSAGTNAFGERHQGKVALIAAFPKIWEAFPDVMYYLTMTMPVITFGCHWRSHGGRTSLRVSRKAEASQSYQRKLFS